MPNMIITAKTREKRAPIRARSFASLCPIIKRLAKANNAEVASNKINRLLSLLIKRDMPPP